MEKILVNGRDNDPHIVGITNELKKINQEYVILDHFSTSDFDTL